MKTRILFAGVLLTWLAGTAQVSNLNFAQHQGLFTNISDYPNPVIITHTLNDDYVYPSKVPLPINFNFAGTLHDSINISENGFAWFGRQATEMQFEYAPVSAMHDAWMKGVIAPFGGDLEPHLHFGMPTSLKSGVTGVAPNRIFIIQWLNTSRFNFGMPGDTLSFQIKLYETTNEIEFVYGYFGVDENLFSGAEVGLKGNLYADFNNRTVMAGNWNASLPGTSQTDLCNVGSFTKPNFGQMFRWTGISTGMKDLYNDKSLIYPNPFSSELRLVVPDNSGRILWSVYDLNGHLLKEGTTSDETLNLNFLNEGTYILNIKSGGAVHSQRIIKR